MAGARSRVNILIDGLFKWKRYHSTWKTLEYYSWHVLGVEAWEKDLSSFREQALLSLHSPRKHSMARPGGER